MYPNFRNETRITEAQESRSISSNSKNLLNSYYQKAKDNSADFENQLPVHAYVETVPVCNLACPSCPQGHPEDREDYLESLNGIKTMGMEDFKDWTKQLVDNGIKSISIYNTNEPLLDPLLFERLDYLRIFELNDIIFMSNATLLNSINTNKLLESPISKVCFSIDAATNATYNKVRPLKSKTDSSYKSERLDKVYENISEFSKKARKIRPDILIRVSFVVGKDNYHEIKLFLERFKEIVDVIDFQYNHVADFNRNSAISTQFKKVSVESCSAPSSTIFLRPNGDLYPCCTVYSYIQQKDLGDNLLIGNLSNLTYAQVLNLDRRKVLLRQLEDEQPSQRCDSCMNNHYCHEDYFETENRFFEPAL